MSSIGICPNSTNNVLGERNALQYLLEVVERMYMLTNQSTEQESVKCTVHFRMDCYLQLF